jgi:hypothetical protein
VVTGSDCRSAHAFPAMGAAARRWACPDPRSANACRAAVGVDRRGDRGRLYCFLHPGAARSCDPIIRGPARVSIEYLHCHACRGPASERDAFGHRASRRGRAAERADLVLALAASAAPLARGRGARHRGDTSARRMVFTMRPSMVSALARRSDGDPAARQSSTTCADVVRSFVHSALISSAASAGRRRAGAPTAGRRTSARGRR